MSLKNNCILIGPSMLGLIDMMEEMEEIAVEDKHLHICTVYNNYISFEDTEVSLTPNELSEILRIIKALPDRDVVITIRDEDTEDEEVFPLTNLSIEFI